MRAGLQIPSPDRSQVEGLALQVLHQGTWRGVNSKIQACQVCSLLQFRDMIVMTKEAYIWGCKNNALKYIGPVIF